MNGRLLSFAAAAGLAAAMGVGRFVFTPLLTSALGSLPRPLYPHGSAIVGTVQQLAGAAGTALFITVMSVVAASVGSAGGDLTSALAEGIHSAFLVGAIIALGAVVLAFFVKAPAADGTAGAVDAILAH